MRNLRPSLFSDPSPLPDWLAAEFVENGWSIKHMLRLMLESDTFQQASLPRPDMARIDADGQVAKLIETAGKRVKIYAPGPDLNARGIPPERVIDGVAIVDYEGFVDLTAAHDSVQAWL